MATKTTQDGFDRELERESESQDCQLPCFRLSALESAFFLKIGLSTRWNFTLKI